MKKYPAASKRVLLLTGFLLALLIIFNLSTFTLYRKAKAYLDNTLGERLQSIAVTLAHTIELSEPDSMTAGEISSTLYSLLHTVKAENLLSNITILTPEGETIVDLSGLSLPGEYNPFIDLDFSAATLARAGFPAATHLYKSGDVYMKSAYAPVRSGEEVTSMVSVEAGASYFEVLKSLRSAIILVDIGSFFTILVLGLLFYRQSVSLDRAQEAVLRGENLAAMGRMAAGIAHEIRNPLSIIKTSAERIQKKYGIDDEVFSFISEEVDELNRILTGYLDFARAEDQELLPKPLQKVVLRSLLLVESDAAERGITLVKEIPEEEIIVSCDEKRMQQALLNVLLNSVQAVGGKGKIAVTVSRDHGYGTVSVADDGPGMDEKTLREIRKPFYTTKEQGSGLGLSITDNIVSAHGGTLDIRSGPGEGTVVTIRIPIADAAEGPDKGGKDAS
jgi:signal transduction histidine kinase